MGAEYVKRLTETERALKIAQIDKQKQRLTNEMERQMERQKDKA
jgi:hypothetical protein